MAILKLKNKTTGEWEEIQAIKGEQGPRGEQGIQGPAGNDAKINNVNTLNIEAGDNITLEQQGNTLKINSTGGGGGGTSDYSDLTNKPQINSVTLSGNKSLNDLGIQPAGNYALESEIPDVSNFITNTVNDLVNYYKKTETFTKQEVNNLIGQIATLQFQVVSTLPQTGDSKYVYLVPSSNPKTQNVKDEYIWVNNSWEQIGSTQIDLTGYATESWVNTQISNFLTQTQIQALIDTALSEYTETDPTVPSHVKSITQTDITNWNNKQAALVSGTNIKTINNESILGSGNINIQGGTSTDVNTYSTSEQRIGTWIDGKPLYRKCFKNTGNLTTIQTGISNIDDVIRLTIMVKSSDNVLWRTIPWCYNANSYDSSYTGGTYIRSNGNIGFQAGTGLTNASKYIAIIEYTKTTD